MNIPHFAFYPHDWLSDTKVQQLTHEERGVYFDILCHMWAYAGERGEFGLPNDDLFFQRLLKVRPAKWKKLRGVLIDGIAPVLLVQDGKITNKRLHKEYEKAKAKSDQAREAAGARHGRKDGQRDASPPSSARDRDQKREGITSPSAIEKHGDKSPQTPFQRESGSADAGANALREACHTDLDLDIEPYLQEEEEDARAREEAAAGSDDGDPEWTNLFDQVFRGNVNERVREELADACDEFGVELVKEAMRRALVNAEGPPRQYLKGIFEGWREEGVFSMARLQELDKQRKQRRTQKRAPPGKRASSAVDEELRKAGVL